MIRVIIHCLLGMETTLTGCKSITILIVCNFETKAVFESHLTMLCPLFSSVQVLPFLGSLS